MATLTSSTSTFCRSLVIAAGVLAMGVPSLAAAQSPATKYQRAQAREKTARAAAVTKPETLRAVARAYEAIVRTHPRTGYADNALWQAAGLHTLVFETTGERRDREQAVRTLTWLRREYPTSPLAKQVPSRLAALETPSRPAAGSPSAVVPARSTATPPAPIPSPARASSAPPAAATTRPVETRAPSTPPPAPARDAPPAPPVIAEALPPLRAPEPSTSVRHISYSRLPKGDRLTIELNEEVVYATSRATNPDRLTIELVNAGFASGIGERLTSLSGALFRSVQGSRTANQSARLVLEITGNPRYSTFPLYNPFRLVVDVEAEEVIPDQAALPAPIVAKMTPPRSSASIGTAGTTTGTTAATTTPVTVPAPAPPSATSRGEFSIARQLGLGVARIVVDPGHGGHDPGAQANGVTEATLVLDVAQRLEKLLLAQPGFEVVLTRRTDQFIPLEERTAIAQREAADMFVSIHANASPQAATRGIETYFLDFASNPQAEAVAARENASSAQTMRLLPELVKAITLNNKLDESRELARQVQASMVKRLAGPNKAIKDFGVKRAPFVVLIGAEMPSVLAEISFLTNRSDAALLKQAAHRQRIAQALADAILSYRGSLKKMGTVAAK